MPETATINLGEIMKAALEDRLRNCYDEINSTEQVLGVLERWDAENRLGDNAWRLPQAREKLETLRAEVVEIKRLLKSEIEIIAK